MYQIPNWSSYQSYKDRKPSWLRLHVQLIDNYEFQQLSDYSQALLPQLWILASEHDDPRSGIIKYDLDRIVFRLRKEKRKIQAALDELEKQLFIIKLQNCNDSVTPETYSNIEKTETDYRAGFGIFYHAYPKKVAPKDAEKAYKIAIRGVSHDSIMAGLEKYKQSVAATERKYIQAPAAWLNKGRWADDYGTPQSSIPDWIRAQR